MFKSLMRFKQKKDNICARPGCNNHIKREKNGTELNYCSSSCQMSHYSPGSSEFYDEFLDSPSYTSSNQWGVWSPNQEEAPPSYSSISNENDLFTSIDNVQVTPLWEAEDDPPLNTSNSRHSSSSNPIDDFPIWLDTQVDPLWTPPSNNTSNRNTSNRNTSNRNTSNRNSTLGNFSPPATPRSNSPSDEEEVHCPRCTFFIRPNKTVCEMCGASITRQEPKRSYKKGSSKPKSTITSYRDLYDEEDENVDEEENEDEYEDPFADPTPRQNNRSSYSSRDNNRNSSSSFKSRNQSSFSSSDNYYDYNYEYSQPRNQSSRNQSFSRNRTSNDNRSSLYQSPTPPSDELWIDEEENYFESIPSRKNSRQRAPPKPYTTPSFFRDTESRPSRNVQKPPTPPLKEKQNTCPACNFDNHLSMTHCEICYTQLNKTPEQDNKRNSNFNRIEETRTKKACSSCSYYNDASSVQCEMCYRPLETIRKPIFSLPSFFSHDVNMTQCPVCTFMNHHTMAQCEMCRSELPGNNLKQQQQQYQQFVDNMPGPVTKLIKLPVDDHDYMTVQQNFRIGVPNANILAIFRVIMPDRIIKAHEAYQKQIAGNNPVANVTHRMYHGSHVACDAKRYYGPSGWTYCNAPDCGLCGITQNGNSCAKSKHGGRMWFADNSGTSLGYCRNDPIKAMFVQEIIFGTKQNIIIVDKEAATLVKFLIIFQ